MRNWAIFLAISLLVLLWVGRTRSGAGVTSPPNCSPLQTEQACVQRFCEYGLIVRGQMPAPAPAVTWTVREARRKQDALLVNVWSGQYVLAGKTRYVECEMIGRTIMSAKALQLAPPNPH